MINKEDFYNNSDHPEKRKKQRMWHNIKSELVSERKSVFSFFEAKSFVLGFGMAIVAFFTLVGVYKTASSFISESDSEIVKLNKIYSATIDKFENEIPEQLTSYNKSQKLDDFIFSKKEELQNINSAIYQVKSDWGDNDLSPIKQKHLLKLYRMKLDLLEKMIVIEENTL